MRATYLWVSRLIAIGVVLQAAFVAFGTFQIFDAAEDGRAFTEDSEFNTGQVLHSIFGNGVIPLLALILLVVSFFAKVPGGVRLAAGVLGLVVLQLLLGIISFGAPVVGLLHGINAFALAGVAGFASRRATPAGPIGPSAEAPAVA